MLEAVKTARRRLQKTRRRLQKSRRRLQKCAAEAAKKLGGLQKKGRRLQKRGGGCEKVFNLMSVQKSVRENESVTYDFISECAELALCKEVAVVDSKRTQILNQHRSGKFSRRRCTSSSELCQIPAQTTTHSCGASRSVSSARVQRQRRLHVRRHHRRIFHHKWVKQQLLQPFLLPMR